MTKFLSNKQEMKQGVFNQTCVDFGRVFPELLYYGLISSKLVSEGDY